MDATEELIQTIVKRALLRAYDKDYALDILRKLEVLLKDVRTANRKPLPLFSMPRVMISRPKV
jgi:hypothetical protein